MDISRPDLKAKKRRRQMMYVGAGIATLIVIAFGLSAIEPAAPKVSRWQVWIDAVKRGAMKREVRGPGTLVPKEVRWIAAETAARVDRFVVKPGATVTADTVIMELSNPEVTDQVLAARSAVTAAEADHAALRMGLESQALDQRANIAIDPPEPAL